MGRYFVSVASSQEVKHIFIRWIEVYQAKYAFYKMSSN